MYTGTIPAVTIYSTWIESVEVSSADDGELVDLSGAEQITLKLIDPRSRVDEMTLTMTNGDITLPSMGIVQWRVEATHMATLIAKLYEVVLLLEDDGITFDLFIGNVSVVE